MLIRLFTLAFILPFISLSSVSGTHEDPITYTKTVYATYYARKFEGRRTTSGARYRAKKFTAAHLTLPFGTLVTVTNPANGKSVVVTINDRGPHSKKYSIDLSEGAAKEIGIFKKGSASVEISYQLPEESTHS